MKKLIVIMIMLMLILTGCGCNCEHGTSTPSKKGSIDGNWRCTAYEENEYCVYIQGETCVIDFYGEITKAVVDTKEKTITIPAKKEGGKDGVNYYELVNDSLVVTGAEEGKSTLFVRLAEDKE